MNDSNQKSKKVLVISILTVIFTLLGGTFAWFTWNSNSNTLVTFTVTPSFSCSVDGGGDITDQDTFIAPTDECTNTENAIVRKITTNITNSGLNDVTMDLWLDVEEMGTGLSDSQNFKYALTSSPTSCTTDKARSGTFNGKVKDSRINLLDGVTFSGNATNEYYLYIWLDSAETSTSTMNQEFTLSLNGNCTSYPIAEPASPVLDETGMIPVTIDNSGNVTTISKDDEDWYNYSEKKWANAILVTEGSRTNYLNKPNTPVTKNDILAYYVWIPKYSYKMNSTSGNGNESAISISFNYNESGYTQHPAFTFNEGMTGFWVGKFETTGESTKPTILNGVSPLVSQTISEQFASSLLFANGTFDDTNRTITFANSPTYGLSSTTDSHMMKNSEWGAVAYLSHSQYGTCTNGVCQEVRYNNKKSSLQTGCGAATSTTRVASTTCTLAYGSGISEYPQSTTGNITGVFDMAGGVYEYVMGNYNNIYNSSYWTFSNLPPTKYYDVYTTLDACDTAPCGGHALNETKKWYGDAVVTGSSNFAWYRRGGHFNDGAGAGVWNFARYNGNSGSYYSWRSVLSTQ